MPMPLSIRRAHTWVEDYQTTGDGGVRRASFLWPWHDPLVKACSPNSAPLCLELGRILCPWAPVNENHRQDKRSKLAQDQILALFRQSNSAKSLLCQAPGTPVAV